MVSREAEWFLQRAIVEQGQGRGAVLGMVAEIQKRHGAVAKVGRSLELRQVFNDMAIGGPAGGAAEWHEGNVNVGRARSSVDRGREQLQVVSSPRRAGPRFE